MLNVEIFDLVVVEVYSGNYFVIKMQNNGFIRVSSFILNIQRIDLIVILVRNLFEVFVNVFEIEYFIFFGGIGSTLGKNLLNVDYG